MKLILLVNSLLLAVALITAYYLLKDRQRLLGNSVILGFIEAVKSKSFGKSFDDFFKETDILPAEYVLAQVGSILICLFIALSSQIDIVKVLLILEGVIHTGIFYKVQGFRQKLRTDLCIIQETLYYQADVGTDLSDTLSYAAELIGNPLKSKMHALAASFRLRQDVKGSINELRELSSIHELQAFCNILMHHLETGNTSEAHEASLNILFQLKRNELLIKRRSNRFFVQCAFGLLFGSVLIVMAVPILLEAYNLFNSAFRP